MAVPCATGFCRLEGRRSVYAHVGCDDYLYLGGDVGSEQTLKIAVDAGLFVDTGFTSPYHVDPATGEDFWDPRSRT